MLGDKNGFHRKSKTYANVNKQGNKQFPHIEKIGRIGTEEQIIPNRSEASKRHLLQ